jgi:hypothetical protein
LQNKPRCGLVTECAAFVTLTQRPDLRDALTTFPDDGVAPFLFHDGTSVALFVGLVERYPEFTVFGLDETTGEPLAMMCTLPFTGPPDGSLPPGGYDAVLLSAAEDALAGGRGPQVSALFATVVPAKRGRGLSGELVRATMRTVASHRYKTLVAPVRPTEKHHHPQVPMSEYAARTRADGLPADPWLRVHARLGGTIVGVAPRSMTISGTLEEWREWTGLPFDGTGPVWVPGGLLPVQCDAVHGTAVYTEPNVWVRHDL